MFESRNVAVPAVALAAALFALGCGNAGSASGARGSGARAGAASSPAGAAAGGAPASGAAPKLGSTGFVGGIQLPSGTGGGASAPGGATGTGTGTGAGTGATPPPASTAPPVFVRALAWNIDDVLPTGPGPTPTNTCWLMFRDPGNTDLLTIKILVNNFPVPSPQAVPRRIGQSGVLVEFAPAPQATGNTVQMTAQDNNGNPIQSQILTVTNSYYWPQGTVPPAFQTVTPPDGWIAPTTPSFVFTTVAPAASYHVVCFHLVPTNGHVAAHEVPVSIEMTAAAGQQATFVDGAPLGAGVVTEIANDPLPPLSSIITNEHYAWQAIALDPTGWGIGTTIDVPDYDNGVSSALPTWPWFDTL
jgi:hypothetical protein